MKPPSNTQNRQGAAILRHVVQVSGKGVVNAPLYMAAGGIQDSAPAGAWTRDLRGHVVFPGLVNAHDHLQFNCFPPLAHAQPFPNSYAWMDAFQTHMSDPAIVVGRALPAEVKRWHGALKNLLGGVTTVAHHDPWHAIFEDVAFPVRVVRRFGWSHSLGLGLPGDRRSPLCYGPCPQESFAATPRTEPWIIHLAEGTDDVAAGELRDLEALGCLGANTRIVHGVGLTESDQERILARRAAVIWCPGSNLAMLGKTLSPGRLVNAGRVALGSDSRISGGSDLLTEMRLAACHSDCTARDLFALVTHAPARLLYVPDVGGLAQGQRADLLLVRETGDDPYKTLLHLHRSDIRAVVRDGEPLIADLDFADWFAVCGIAVTPITLDGKPKLIASDLLKWSEAARLEPGLVLTAGTGLLGDA
jgi:cytosine/adenosine deaminase-related metal-dependent hydrolase